MSGSGKQIEVGIVGVSGYSGIELARILARHPHFVLRAAISDKWAGRPVGERIPLAGPAADVRCLPQAEGVERVGSLGLAFLCTPPEVSIELAPRLLAGGTRVVDLSGGFRLPASAYPRWYGFTHANPDLLAEAVYSMPEAATDPAALRSRLTSARLVSNPGCYPTASALAVLPMLRAGLVSPDGLIVDAKSGTTGAGRKGTEDWSFTEIADDFKAYRVTKHQHTPEIEEILAQGVGGGARPVLFTPHLLPVRRGILATVYGRLTPAALAHPSLDAAVEQALRAFAEDKPFLRVVAPEAVTLRAAVGTNRVVLGARADRERGLVVALASIDNLIKGASGHAVQNANMMFGFAETAGLSDELSGFGP